MVRLYSEACSIGQNSNFFGSGQRLIRIPLGLGRIEWNSFGNKQDELNYSVFL